MMCNLSKWWGETSGWFMVCMGDGVDNKFVVVHDKTNRQ